MATNIDREGIWKMKDKSYRKTKPTNSGNLYKKRNKAWHKKGAELNQRLLNFYFILLYFTFFRCEEFFCQLKYYRA